MGFLVEKGMFKCEWVICYTHNEYPSTRSELFQKVVSPTLLSPPLKYDTTNKDNFLKISFFDYCN